MDAVEEGFPLPDGVSGEWVIMMKNARTAGETPAPVMTAAGFIEPIGRRNGPEPGGPGRSHLLSGVSLFPYQVEEFIMVVIGQNHDQGTDSENGRHGDVLIVAGAVSADGERQTDRRPRPPWRETAVAPRPPVPRIPPQ